MVEQVSNPTKMLRLLRKEIEEADIALHGEISKLTRQKTRAEASAQRLTEEVTSWSEKAKVAMDHGREDLARSALLAREDIKLQAKNFKADTKRLADEISVARAALEQLEAKLAETNSQLRAREASESASRVATSAGPADSTADRQMDRIANLERRVDHTLGDQPQTGKSAATIDAEIAAMGRDAAVDAELEKLRSSAGTKKKRKTE
ncbi:phage shock protein PspA [Pontixanthobacter gangjinensis]